MVSFVGNTFFLIVVAMVVVSHAASIITVTQPGDLQVLGFSSATTHHQHQHQHHRSISQLTTAVGQINASSGQVQWGAESKPFDFNQVNFCVNTRVGGLSAYAVSTYSGYDVIDSTGTVARHAFINDNGTQVLYTMISWSYSERLNGLIALGWPGKQQEPAADFNSNWIYPNLITTEQSVSLSSDSPFVVNDDGPSLFFVNLNSGKLSKIDNVHGDMFLMCAAAFTDGSLLDNAFFHYGMLDEEMNQFTNSYNLKTKKQYAVAMNMNDYGSLMALSAHNDDPSLLFAWTERGQLWMIQPMKGLAILLRDSTSATSNLPVLGGSVTYMSSSAAAASTASEITQFALFGNADDGIFAEQQPVSYSLISQTQDQMNASAATLVSSALPPSFLGMYSLSASSSKHIIHKPERILYL